MEIASKNRSYVKNQQTACIDYRVVLFTGVGKPPVCVGKHHLYRQWRYGERTCLKHILLHSTFTIIILYQNHQITLVERLFIVRIKKFTAGNVWENERHLRHQARLKRVVKESPEKSPVGTGNESNSPHWLWGQEMKKAAHTDAKQFTMTAAGKSKAVHSDCGT